MPDVGKLTGSLRRNKYVLLVLALGLLLLLLPRKTATEERAAAPADRTATSIGEPMEASGIPLDTESERLAALLCTISGVGNAEVLLSREGAVIVCTGADNARVRLEVTNAVSVYTGLGSDRITVLRMK